MKNISGHCFSEENILNNARMHVKSHTATKEEELLVKITSLYKFEKYLDMIHNEITLPNHFKEYESIKKAFFDFEYAWRKLYDIISPYCGNCDEYTFDLLYSYLEDTLINKFNSEKKPSRTVILLGIIREEMEEGKWYTITDIFEILKSYPEYNKIFNRNNIGILLQVCTEEGYFIDNMNGRIHNYKKTNKKYLDLQEDLKKTIMLNQI